MMSTSSAIAEFRDIPIFRSFNDLTDASHYRRVPEGWCLIVADIEGSTLLIPPARFDAVARALDGVRHLSEDGFGMRLRVGAMRLGDLGPDDGIVEVARFSERDAIRIDKTEVFSERCSAMFRGGGISAAETYIKADPQRYAVPDEPDNRGDLSGLSEAGAVSEWKDAIFVGTSAHRSR